MPEEKPNTPPLVLRVAAQSDVGMRRATNQDACAVVPPPEEGPIVGDAFLMVADGMGAHAAGELASKMAADAIPLAYQKSASDSAPSALRRAIREANDAIHAKGASAAEFHGMGTTCSCLVVTQGAALVGHVGDSRVYRLRDGVMEQLTFDHSLVWEMAAASNVSEDKVPSCIPKNVITRSLGPHETVNVDLEGPHALCAGDVYLLCSDGLTGVVSDTLAGGVLGASTPEDAAQTLIDLANLRGGPDNITVVVARVDDASQRDAPASASGKRRAGRFDATGLAVAAGCLVACVWCLTVGNQTGLLASSVGLGASLVYAFFKRAQPVHGADATRSLGGPYGNGPYRRIACGDPEAAAQDLRGLVRELAELDASKAATRQEGSSSPNGDGGQSFNAPLQLDWSRHAEAQRQGDAAFNRGDYADAISTYARVVREVMHVVRDDDGTHRFRASTEVLG